MLRYALLFFSLFLACAQLAPGYPIQLILKTSQGPVSLDGGALQNVDLTLVFQAETTNLLPGGGTSGADRYPNLIANVSSVALGYSNVPATNPLNFDVGNGVYPDEVAIVSGTALEGIFHVSGINTWNRVSSLGPVTAEGAFCNNCGGITLTLANGHSINMPTIAFHYLYSSFQAIVYAPPAITKSFGAVAIPTNGIAALTFTLSNPPANPFPLTGIKFLDTLPAGLRVANPNGLSGSCVPISTISATPGANSVGLGNLTLAPGASCSFSVNVVGVAEGNQVNTTGPVGSIEAAPGEAATAIIFVGPAFQVTYAANLNAGESYINVGNNGSNGAPLLGPGFGNTAGNICVNVYAFSPDEQMISCCSCLVTPNGLANIGVIRDLTAKTLTGVVPTSVVVKLLTTLAGAGGSGTSCANSAAVASSETIAGGAVAWRTTLHAAPVGFGTTETPFTNATLSAGELASLRGRCASILGNGSGFGICRSCQPGALGADRM